MTSWNRPSGITAFIAYSLLVILVAPIVVLLVAAFNENVIPLPLTGLSITWFKEALDRQDFLDAAARSALVSVGVATACVVLATTLAVAAVRSGRRWVVWLGHLSLSSLFIPHSVMAFAMLALAKTVGLVGNISVLVVAYLVVSFPLAYRVIVGALQTVDTSVEDAARVFGMGPVRAFFSTTARVISGGILVAAVMSVVAIFNDAVFSSFLGNLRSETFGMKLFGYMANEYDSLAAAYGGLMFAVSIPAIYLVIRLGGSRSRL
jgi:ABC-type spermidine/putrescine transport system permease subunit II